MKCKISINRIYKSELLISLILFFQMLNAYLILLFKLYDLNYPFASVLYIGCYICGLAGYTKVLSQKKCFIIFSVISYIAIFSFIVHYKTIDFAFDLTSLRNFLLSDGTKLFGIHLPVFLMLLHGVNYGRLLKTMNNFGLVILTLFITCFILYAFVYNQGFDYMNMSYSALPYALICFGYGNIEKDRTSYIVGLISILFMLITGCRGATLICLLYLVEIFAIVKKRSISVKYVIFTSISVIVLIIIFSNLDLLMEGLADRLETLGFNSRILSLYYGSSTESGLFHYNDRAALQIPLLQSINLSGHGIFGDRVLNTVGIYRNTSGVYAHNIFLELVTVHTPYR